ncbi:MAG TPA: hypothetical protein VH853_16255 [Polyangia bacterium]|nr:hypothetical protein [Polyangia bacterium]
MIAFRDPLYDAQLLRSLPVGVLSLARKQRKQWQKPRLDARTF